MSASPIESPHPDQSLLRELVSKTPAIREKAWDYLYEHYFPMIREHVDDNSGTEDDATDIFQDALMVLHYNLDNDKFRSASSLKTYFFGICKNLWLRELKKRQRQLIAFAEMTSEYPDGTGYLVNVEIVTLLMAELADDCRNILTEFYFNQRTMAELRVMFNVSTIGAAKNKKRRCLNHLVLIFREKGVSYTS